MFWDDKDSKKEKSKSANNSNKLDRDDFLGNIDNIKLVRKPKPKKIKKKRKPFLTQLLLIFLVLELAFCGVFTYKKTQGKTDALRMFANGKYLVLFGNNAELRPAGGFIGSFAVITFRNFQIEKIDFNANIYTLDQKFVKENKIPAPEQMVEIWPKATWSMRDSNYAVSYPEAARKVEWFYTQESSDQVDGVITLNASVIRDLIAKTGPVKISNGTEITADNFFTEINAAVEKTYYDDTANWTENQPKEVLAEMMPQVFNKALSQNKIELGKFFLTQLKEKQILFYSNNLETEEAILAENWGGKVQDFSGDYLHINNANIGGMKSSLNVKESVNYNVSSEKEGIIASLTLIRSHTGTNVWPDGTNQNWTQILVPNDSVLQTAELNGKDILSTVKVGEETGKTVFSLWINTAPGASNVLNLKYTLPISASNYQLLAQKQSGNLGDNFVVTFNSKVLFDGVLNEDKVIK